MASTQASPPRDLDSTLDIAVQGGDWTALEQLMESDQLTDQQKARVVVGVMKYGNVQQFSRYVRPSCSSTQLDVAMTELVSAGLWAAVCRLSQCVGHEYLEWQVGDVSVSNNLLAIVAKGRWSELGAVQHGDTDVSAAQKQWALQQACQHAAQLDLIESVLPQCADEDVDCVLQELVARGLWWAVGSLFFQRRAITETQRGWAITKAAKDATTWEFSDFILPHCTKRQLISVSRQLVTRRLWWALGILLKKDAHMFKECILPACGNADTDSFMSHLMSVGQWESTQKLLQIVGTGERQWQIGDGSVRGKQIQLAAEGQWSALVYEAHQSLNTPLLAWVIEEMSKRAGKNEILAAVVHMCPISQIPSVIRNLVKRGFIEDAAKLLRRIVGETLEIWAKVSPTAEHKEEALWSLVRNHSYDLKTSSELFTEVHDDKLYGSMQLLSKLIWESLSFLDLIAAATAKQLLCQVLFDSAVRITVMSVCDHLDKVETPVSTDSQAQLAMSQILKEIRATTFSLTQSVQRLCKEFKHTLTNSCASHPVFALSVIRAVMKHCCHQGQWSDDTETILSILTTVPIVPEIQTSALRILLTEEKWGVICLADLSYVGEQVRRLLFSRAVKQKQWSLVRQWADHTLYADQRSWALEKACMEGQWDVCLRLAEHGMTEEEATRVHYRVALNADWRVVLDMYKHETDVEEVRQMLSKAKLKKGDGKQDQERRRRVCELADIGAKLEARMTSLETLQSAVEQGDWQAVLFTVRQRPTADNVSMALSAAVARKAWGVVMQLIRLGIHTLDQQPVLLDMIRHQQWGVCGVIVERGLNAELYMDAIPQLMEMNQWTVVGKMMDYEVDDAVRWQVMRRAWQMKEGNVVSHCIKGMKQQLSVQEREDVFHTAVISETLQTVMPLVAEKDDTGLQHRDIALQLAISQQHWDIVDHCLHHGADINTPDDKGNLPIHRAAQRDDWEMVVVLAKRGGDPSSLDSTGMSVLHTAIQEEKWKYVKLLISLGSDLQQSATHEEEKRTPLEMLIDGSRQDIIA